MKTAQFHAIIIALVLSGCHWVRDPEVSIDGRYGTRCADSGDGTAAELCMPSFYRVIAEPEKYHDRKVMLVGYLVEHDDRYVLFPGQEPFYIGSNIEGIELLLNATQEAELMDLPRKGVGGYGVIGIFDAKYPGAGLPRLGQIVVERLWGPSLIVEDRLLRLNDPE